MNEQTPNPQNTDGETNPQNTDELISAYTDGETNPQEDALIETDLELTQRAAEFAAVREAVAACPPTASDALRDLHISRAVETAEWAAASAARQAPERPAAVSPERAGTSPERHPRPLSPAGRALPGTIRSILRRLRPLPRPLAAAAVLAVLGAVTAAGLIGGGLLRSGSTPTADSLALRSQAADDSSAGAVLSADSDADESIAADLRSSAFRFHDDAAAPDESSSDEAALHESDTGAYEAYEETAIEFSSPESSSLAPGSSPAGSAEHALDASAASGSKAKDYSVPNTTVLHGTTEADAIAAEDADEDEASEPDPMSVHLGSFSSHEAMLSALAERIAAARDASPGESAESEEMVPPGLCADALAQFITGSGYSPDGAFTAVIAPDPDGEPDPDGYADSASAPVTDVLLGRDSEGRLIAVYAAPADCAPRVGPTGVETDP